MSMKCLDLRYFTDIFEQINQAVAKFLKLSQILELLPKNNSIHFFFSKFEQFSHNFFKLLQKHHSIELRNQNVWNSNFYIIAHE